MVSSVRRPRERGPVPLVRRISASGRDLWRPCAARTPISPHPKEQQRGRTHLGLDRDLRRHDRDLHLRPGHRRPPAARAEHEGVSRPTSRSTSGWPSSSASVCGSSPGHQHGLEFFSGWLVEYSLSIDNLFIFIIIMAKFAVPRELPAVRPDDRHRDGPDDARDLHRRRRRGDRAVQLGLLPVRHLPDLHRLQARQGGRRGRGRGSRRTGSSRSSRRRFPATVGVARQEAAVTATTPRR